MPLNQPKPVKFGDVTETTIDITWQAVEGANGYRVMVVDFGIEEGWKSDKVMVHKFDAKTTKATIDDLYPTSTFCFRIVAFNEDEESSPSKVVDCDTAVANCGPDNRCVLQ
jgi:hypothetical protein